MSFGVKTSRNRQCTLIYSWALGVCKINIKRTNCWHLFFLGCWDGMGWGCWRWRQRLCSLSPNSFRVSSQHSLDSLNNDSGAQPMGHQPPLLHGPSNASALRELAAHGHLAGRSGIAPGQGGAAIPWIPERAPVWWKRLTWNAGKVDVPVFLACAETSFSTAIKSLAHPIREEDWDGNQRKSCPPFSASPRYS